MNASSIVALLEKSGYMAVAQGSNIVLEDPSCIIRNLTDFMDFAWIVMGGLAMVLLFGWGISLIRGAEVKYADNLWNLFLLFAGLAAVPAVMRFLVDDNLLKCEEIVVPVSDINKVLELKNAKFTSPAASVSVAEMAAGFINEHPMVDARAVLSDDDQRTFQSVVQAYGLAVRGCEREGCGTIGASRETPPYQHEGTDLYRAPGDPVPALFDGTVLDIDAKYSGLYGLSIRNDNGTTTYYGYVTTNLKRGDRVRAGDAVAVQQDIAMHPDYANVPNHVHLELWTGASRSVGNVVNVEALF